MARPLRHIVDDLQVLLKQTYDDKEFQDIQVAYWCTIIGDRLKSQHIQKRESGAFLSVYADVPVSTFASTTNPNQIKNRKYIELPEYIYDYNLDGGIEYVSYYDKDDNCGSEKWKNVKFNRTSPAKAESLYYSPYTTPTTSNPSFYRVDKYLYLLGLECSNVDAVEIGIYMILPSVTTVDLDADWPFPAELLSVLQRNVLDLARFGLMIPEQAKINTGSDGNDNTQDVPTQKLVSVNDPAISTSDGDN